MEVNRFVLGSFATNTYLLINNDECLLIDPASKADKLFPLLEDKKLLAVLLTHGHFDHIKACDGLYEKYKMPIYLNKKDLELTKDNSQGRVFGLLNVPTIKSPIFDLKEGKMEIGSFKFEVIFTPGHTKGSVCFLFDDFIFTGDTLFKMSAGRTDLKGGDSSELKASLRILKDLDYNLVVYPGHDETSTMLEEINNNPYLM